MVDRAKRKRTTTEESCVAGGFHQNPSNLGEMSHYQCTASQNSASSRSSQNCKTNQNVIIPPLINHRGAASPEPRSFVVKSVLEVQDSQAMSFSCHNLTRSHIQQPQKTLNVLEITASLNPVLLKQSRPDYSGRTSSNTEPQRKRFVCEICDGRNEDLEQLRGHMRRVHYVKVNQIFRHPLLNCDLCDRLFYTAEGLLRHLLGFHGLVTSRLEELANRGQDGGFCGLCSRVYVTNLVDHINVFHNLPLKTASLSYRCIICSCNFTSNTLFENHVRLDSCSAVKRLSDTDSIAPRKKIPRFHSK